MKWVSCLERMPVIPEDKYGVSVIVLSYDKHYAELYDDKKIGYSISNAIYDKKTQCFIEHQCWCGKENPLYKNLGDWCPLCEIVTHWLEIDELPNVPTDKEYNQLISDFHKRNKLGD